MPAAGSRAAAPTLGEEFILLGPRGSRPFDASELESELRLMWHSAAAEGPAQGRAVYRAALANLVVPLDPAGVRQITPVLTEVTRRHPSRLFLIETSATAHSEPLRARVTALCHLRPGADGAVCSEQIVLQPGAGAEALVPSAVRSLLVGGLPVVLLDVHPGAPAGWREELARTADLVLGDSALGDASDEAAPLWDRIAREGTSRNHDLAWARLNPWRVILAALFDEPQLAACLETLEELDLAHGSGPKEDPSAPALLLAGWVAARLHWTPRQREGNALHLRGPRGPVRVRFRRDPGEDTHSVSGVRMRAATPHPLSLEIARHGRNSRASIRIDVPAAERREVLFPYREFAACIVDEIHRHEPNPALAEAVTAAQALRRAWAGSA